MCRPGRSCLLMALGLLMGREAQGQRTRVDTFDTTYVHDYSRILTGRLFLSTKYNRLRLGTGTGLKDLEYRPNNRINFGVGASYRALTLNIGVGVPLLNRDDAIRGRTHYIDAQANIHTKRWATNLFLQRFAGYFVSSHTLPELGWVQNTTYPTRPDLREFNVGVSSVHIFNNDRFSYRASFNQDAWQRKSQGSWLLGGYATYFHLGADSSLVPTLLDAQFEDGLHLRRGSFWDVGPMGGYVYTFVLHEHWFLTGSAVLGIGASLQHAETDPVGSAQLRWSTDVGPGFHVQLRAGMGYNSSTHYFGLSFNQENIGYLIDARDRFSWAVGNVRLNFVQRFNTRIGFMDRGIRWFRKRVTEPVQEALPLPKS
ncbi:MAG: DUF4421 domain-containing protein [Flavobacteriales bacterium]